MVFNLNTPTCCYFNDFLYFTNPSTRKIIFFLCVLHARASGFRINKIWFYYKNPDQIRGRMFCAGHDRHVSLYRLTSYIRLLLEMILSDKN
jgi:hypothetical protein